MFNTNLQRMLQIGVELLYVLEALYKQLALELIAGCRTEPEPEP